MNAPKLRRIDCIVNTVPEDALADATEQYESVLGLEKLWERPGQVGFRMADHEEGFAELVLSTDAEIPDGLVHYLVDDVREATDYYAERGFDVTHGPEEIPVGHVATLENEWGHEFDVMDFDG